MEQQNQDKSVYEQALESVISRLENVEKFTLDQLPVVCQQIVAEREVEEKFDLITNGIVAVISLSVAIYSGFVCSDYAALGANEGKAALCGGLSLVTAIFFLASTGCTLSAFKNLLSLKAAPKLYILNQLRRLIR